MPRRRVRGARRALFFGFASVWGFIVGVAGLLGAMSSAGQSVQPPAGALMGLIPVFALALFGGVVIAWAYGESRRRSR